MASAPDHALKDAGTDSNAGAIVAGVIALLFLGFVVHAATLAPSADAGKAPAASAGAPKAAH
ncbi:hypothetical protein [Tardiphaga sp.]|jgi:hypothetical protein|uniref:hypothetical protein n=1 Tax=Tardiphaga sp. TaxID=1926292 RepID=UPI0037D9C6B8